MTKKAVIVFYSMYGHIETLAKEIALGLKDNNINVEIYRIPEILPENVLHAMHAPPKSEDIPEIKDVNVLKDADAIIFGTPTRFGTMSAQMKNFLDHTGQLWSSGALKGKVASVFFSSASLGFGQETTALSMLPYFVHNGMVFLPLGSHPLLTLHSESHGGSPWGAGTITGNYTSPREISKNELIVAYDQGVQIANYLNS